MYILTYISPSIIIISCVIVDFLSLCIFLKIENTTYGFFYCLLSAFQLLTSIVIIKYPLIFNYNFSIELTSNFACKLVHYCEVNFASIATWFLVYINIDRVFNLYDILERFRRKSIGKITVSIFIILFNSILLGRMIIDFRIVTGKYINLV